MSRRYNDYTMKELAKMVANTNEKSLSEMVDSLNKFEDKPLKFVDLETDIANLKKKIASQEPLFTLTAEEIMEVKCAIANRIHDLEIMSKYSPKPNVFLLEGIKICENLLKRLNDYKNGH